jgi:putative ABC transport system permease protein
MLWAIAARNARRDALRTALTLLGVAVGVLAFIGLRTVIDAWGVGAKYAAKDRLTTRHAISYGLPLPKRYVDDIASHVPGVKSVSHCDWFGGRWARNPSVFFANLACADNAFDVYPEIAIAPQALTRWRQDKQGAIIGDRLAQQLDLKVGDRLTLDGTFYPGSWELQIDGIYSASPQAPVDRSSLFFRWDYKNERVAPWQRDTIGWVFTRVDVAAESARVARDIDRLFAERPVRTLTMSEHAANTALLGSVSAVLAALDLASLFVLTIVALILGNALAMGVRERTREYAVLLVLGFRPRTLRALVVLEAMALSWAGALLGSALAFPLVQLGLGGWLQENMGKFFPEFRISLSTLIAAYAMCVVVGAVASWLPALHIGRLSPSAALRKVV